VSKRRAIESKVTNRHDEKSKEMRKQQEIAELPICEKISCYRHFFIEKAVSICCGNFEDCITQFKGCWVLASKNGNSGY